MTTMREQYLGNGDGRAPADQTAGPLIRQMPHSREAEEALLGSMIVGGFGVIDDIRQRFPNAEAFYIPAHQTIYHELLLCRETGIPVDLVTLTQFLTDQNLLESVGGASFVTHLFTVVPSAANAIYYADIVREKFILREIIRSGTQAISRAYEEQDEVTALLNDYVSAVIEIGNLSTATESLRPIGEFVPGAVQEIEAIYRNRGKPIGLPTGLPDLDRMMGGFQAPLTYYVGARPAMGKSSLMIEFADHLAIGDALLGSVAEANAGAGHNVAIFSIEMTGRQLVKRILCDRASINLQRMRDGFFDKEKMASLKKVSETVEKGRIFIDEKSELSIFEFRARARRAVLKFGCKLILIDYLQKMRSTSKRAQGSRELEINEIAQGISATAKELNVPIVVLCQLNRENEKRPDKTPLLSDIRESGSVEQEARVVMMLHRPAYYAKNDTEKRKLAKRAHIHDVPSTDQEEKEMMEEAGLKDGRELPWREAFKRYAELHLVKQNEGPTAAIKLRFVEEFARFESVTQKLYSNDPGQRQGADEEDFEN